MGGIINSINAFTSFFGRLYTAIVDFFSLIGSFFSSIFSILKSLWYGATTLFSGVNDLINYIFKDTLFSNISDGFAYLSSYIGDFGAYTLAGLLLIVFVRIGIAFVFKILRMNIDYYKLPSITRTRRQHSSLKK